MVSPGAETDSYTLFILKSDDLLLVIVLKRADLFFSHLPPSSPDRLSIVLVNSAAKNI